MIRSLDDIILYSGLLSYVKVLFLAGDIFDRLLSLDDPCVAQIDKWIARLLKECAANGTKLRVLEGTPSHDSHQSSRFVTILELLEIELDFRYVFDVEIEYMEDLKIHVLYIRDEAHPSTKETKAAVETLLQARGLEQVDIAVMHGYFKHQLPYVTNEGSYHDLEFYEHIVRKWITIGHVHTRSRVGKAIAQGSFDCLGHNEEEEKGMMLATIGNAKDDAWFLNNPTPHVHKTVMIYDMSVEEALAFINEVAVTLPVSSRLRIQGEPGNPIFEHVVEVQVSWPQLIITKHPKSLNEKTIAEKVLEDVVSKWQPVRYDKSNLADLLVKRLEKKAEHDTATITRLDERLKECL